VAKAKKRTQKDKDLDKLISASVISEKTTEELYECLDVLELFAEYKTNYRLKNTYTKGIRKAYNYNGNGKIYCSYKNDMARTGRLSCSAYSAGKRLNPEYPQVKGSKERIMCNMGISFHTLPRETSVNIRKGFVSPVVKGDRWLYITADFSAAELRILTHIADEANMRKAFIEGMDLHSYAASLLYDKGMDEINKEERQIAKAVSFLIVFGGDEHTLSSKHAVDLVTAKQIIEKYLKVFPGVKKYIEDSKSFVKEHLYAESIFGRRRNLENVTSARQYIIERALRQGINAPVQSSASDMIICSIIGIREEFIYLGLEARFSNSVHDSVEIICPAHELREVLGIIWKHMVINEYMRDTFGIELTVPMKIDCEVGYSFGEGAEVHFDDKGRVTNMEEIQEYLQAA
jgi:DNA polymerase I